MVIGGKLYCGYDGKIYNVWPFRVYDSRIEGKNIVEHYY